MPIPDASEGSVVTEPSARFDQFRVRDGPRQERTPLVADLEVPFADGLTGQSLRDDRPIAWTVRWATWLAKAANSTRSPRGPCAIDAALVVTAAGLAVAALAFAASRLVPSNYRRSDPVVGSMAVRQYRHSETITTARHV